MDLRSLLRTVLYKLQDLVSVRRDHLLRGSGRAAAPCSCPQLGWPARLQNASPGFTLTGMLGLATLVYGIYHLRAQLGRSN